MTLRRRFLVRLVRLTPLDDRILRDYAEERGLDPRDLSAVLRIVLREWFVLRLQAASSLNRPQIVPPWDLRREMQRIKASLNDGKPPPGWMIAAAPSAAREDLAGDRSVSPARGYRQVTPQGAPVFATSVQVDLADSTADAWDEAEPTTPASSRPKPAPPAPVPVCLPFNPAPKPRRSPGK